MPWRQNLTYKQKAAWVRCNVQASRVKTKTWSTMKSSTLKMDFGPQIFQGVSCRKFPWNKVRSCHETSRIVHKSLFYPQEMLLTIHSISPRIKPRSPALQADSLLSEPPGKPKNTGVGSLPSLQGIFPTQESNRGLLHCRRILYQLSYQFSSVAQSCPTLWDPMDCSTPSFPVHHQFPELTQTHVHRVGDAIQDGW